MMKTLVGPMMLAAAMALAPLMPAGAGAHGATAGLSAQEMASGQVSCRLPNGQVVRLTPRDCAARGGTVVGG